MKKQDDKRNMPPRDTKDAARKDDLHKARGPQEFIAPGQNPANKDKPPHDKNN
ncbi:MAG: hypothetical protein KGZ57_04210 [Dethiobacter sp.]|nr:hypothetical protein [Dethiobacter sp.]